MHVTPVMNIPSSNVMRSTVHMITRSVLGLSYSRGDLSAPIKIVIGINWTAFMSLRIQFCVPNFSERKQCSNQTNHTCTQWSVVLSCARCNRNVSQSALRSLHSTNITSGSEMWPNNVFRQLLFVIQKPHGQHFLSGFKYPKHEQEWCEYGVKFCVFIDWSADWLNDTQVCTYKQFLGCCMSNNKMNYPQWSKQS